MIYTRWLILNCLIYPWQKRQRLNISFSFWRWNSGKTSFFLVSCPRLELLVWGAPAGGRRVSSQQNLLFFLKLSDAERKANSFSLWFLARVEHIELSCWACSSYLRVSLKMRWKVWMYCDELLLDTFFVNIDMFLLPMNRQPWMLLTFARLGTVRSIASKSLTFCSKWSSFFGGYTSLMKENKSHK